MNIKIALFAALFLGLQQAEAQETNPFSLAQCRALALENNKKIQAAQHQIEASKEAAEGAKLNSKAAINASFVGAHFGKPLSSMLPAVLANASVDVTQPIYVGGKIKLGMAATEKAVEIYEGQKTLTEAEVLLAVEKAYWQVVQVQEKIVLAQKYKVMLGTLQTDLKNAYDAGLIYKNDLLRVEVSLNEVEFNIVKANDGLVLSKLSLAQAIGLAGKSDFVIQDSVAGNFNALEHLSLETFADKRPEILILNKAIEAQKLQTKIIQADLKPTIGLMASGFGAVGSKVNFSNGNNFLMSYYAMASISMPIFDWGKNARKVKEQNFKIQAQEVQLEETKEFLNLEVQQAYLTLNQSAKKINLSTLSLNQAEENLRLATDRFDAGTIVGKDVQEAQAIWQEAYSSLIDAKIDYKVNEASYKKAIGEIN